MSGRRGSLKEFFYRMTSKSDVTDEQDQKEDANNQTPVMDQIMALHMWNQTDVAFEKHKDTTSSGKVVKDFLQKLSAIEERYAADLLKLTNATKFPNPKFAEGSTLERAFKDIVKMTWVRARSHGKSVDTLKQLCDSQSLNEVDSMLEPHSKMARKRVKDAAKQLADKDAVYQKIYKKRFQFEQDAQKKLKLPEKEKKFWSARLSEKKQKKLQELDKELREADIARSMVRSVHNEAVLSTLNKLQALEYQRVGIIRQTLGSVADHFGRVAQLQWKSTMSARFSVRGHREQEDLMEWIERNTLKKHFTCPWMPEVVDIDANNAAHSRSKSGGGRFRGSLIAHNPFSRASILNAEWRATRAHVTDQPDHQDQAQKDKQKFDQLSSKRQKRLAELRNQRLKEEKARNKILEEEREKSSQEREQLIAQLMEAKQSAAKAQEENSATKGKLDEENAMRERKLQQLLREKEAAEREKEELAKLLAEKEKQNLEQLAQLLPPPADDAADPSVPPTVTENKDAEDADDDEWEEVTLKTPIVLDLGQHSLKVGFAGMWTPALVVPNLVASYPHPMGTIDPSYENAECRAVGAAAQHLAMANMANTRVNTLVFCDNPSYMQDLKNLLQSLFQQLGVDVRDHPVLVTQPVLAPLALKTKLESLLFDEFDVPALYVARAPQLTAYAYGHSSGLVVDVGHSSCQVVPIIDGFIMDAYTTRALHLGGKKDSQRVVDFLSRYSLERAKAAQKKGKLDPEEEDKLLEDQTAQLAMAHIMAGNIKNQLTVAAESEEQYQSIIEVLETVKGLLGGGSTGSNRGNSPSQSIMLELQKELLKCGEVLFQPKKVLNDQEESLVPIPKLIVNIVSKCDINTRRDLLSNVFLAGGISTMPGFGERLERELKKQLPHARSYIRVHASEAQFATWVGGSVLSSLPDFQESWVFPEDRDKKDE